MISTCHADRPAYGRGLCRQCYGAAYRRERGIKPRVEVPPLGVRMSKRRDESGGPFACWPRIGATVRMHVKGGLQAEVRRVAWFLEHGKWPPRYQHVETVCGNRLCLNPKHLVCPTPEERVWLWIKKGTPNECWEWMGRRHRNYGQFKRFGRHGVAVPAHRFVYEVVNGPIIGRLVVMHTCDNPPCCNPAHLKLGTDADNHADMVAKGRHPIIARARARKAGTVSPHPLPTASKGDEER